MKNRLITPQLTEAFSKYPLYSQDEKGKNAICICTFQIGNIHWYITEGNVEEHDCTMFGVVTGLYETEYGYISLNELEKIELDASQYGLGKLKVVQNPAIQNIRLAEIDDPLLQQFLEGLERV